jgi:phosphatidylinositol alpha-1,6-mannosyltransferase
LARIPDSYTLFVSDLFLYHGGVSDYTDNFAQQLYKKKRLKTVITPFPSNIKRDYSIEQFDINPERKSNYFDRWVITRKLVTLFYYARLYYSAYKGLKKMKRQEKNDCLIFTEYYTFQFDIIIFCARWLKLKYAIVFHGLDLICAKNKRFTHFNKNFSNAAFIIYNSAATSLLALELLKSKHKHSMILFPGIDVALLGNYTGIENNILVSPKKQGEIFFSTVSRLVKRKGIDLGIRMVSELEKANLSVRYYIAGSGEEENVLKSLVKQLNADRFIIFLGDISNENKYALLETSDIFLFPNHSAGNNDFEGFGISCIEASFFGNIIIGGNHGGVKEAVLDKETGFLFDFDDPASINQAVITIKSCIENPEQMEKIIQRGIEYVRTKYDWNRLINHFIQSEQAFFAA